MSRWSRKLARGEFALSLEITPPRAWRPKVLRRRAAGLAERVDAVDVIQRAGRIPSLAASRWLRRQGFEPIWHLVTHGRSRQRVVAEIERGREAGLDLVLCLRGDPRGPPARDPMLVRECVEQVRGRLPGALVGVSFDPYAPPERSLPRLLKKLDAGARFVLTQPVFAPDALAPVAAVLSRTCPEVALVPMLMPLLSIASARRLEQRLGIALSGPLLERLREGGAAAGWRLLEENLRALARESQVAGANLMTFELDPPPSLLERLAAAVDTLQAPAGPEERQLGCG